MGASLFGSVTQMAKAWSARRTCSVSTEKRLYSAVAVMQDLERRQLLSAVNPFPGPTIVNPEVPATEENHSTSFAMAVADINGDGIPDVVQANFDGTVTVTTQYSDQHGRGTGSLYYNSKTSTISDGLGDGEGNAHDLAVGTLANGDPVIVVANNYGHSGGQDVSVIVGDGHGGFQHYRTYYATESSVNGLAIAHNIYNDGETDVVTANSNGTLTIISDIGTGDADTEGNFSPSDQTSGGLYSPEIGDFNGDGSAFNYNATGVDIAFTDGADNLFVNYQNSYYHRYDTTKIATNIESFDVGKLNSTANAYSREFRADDIVALSTYSDGQQTLKTYIGGVGSEGSLGLGSALVADYYIGGAVHIADVNGDGKLDAMVTYYNYTSGGADISISETGFYGYGNGRLGASAAFATGAITPPGDSLIHTTALADMNGDGKADLLFGYFNYDNGNSPVGVRLNSDTNVPSAPVITSPNITFFTYGSYGTFNVTSTGGPDASITSSELPSGVTLIDNGNGTATLEGDASPGEHEITLYAYNTYNGGTTASQSFILDEFASFTVNVPYGDDVEQNITPSEHPATATFVNASSFTTDGITLSGDPTDGYTLLTDQDDITTPVGQYKIDISATNGIDPPATEEITLNVVAPVIFTSADDVRFAKGVDGSFTISTNSSPVEGDDVSLNVFYGALPPGMIFVDNDNGTATIEGTPTKDGHFSITVDADNGITEDSQQSIAITVEHAAKPTIKVSDPTFQVGSFGSFTVTTTGYPSVPLGDLNVTGLPPGVGFTDNGDGTGTVSGTPTAPGGTYELTVTAGNGIGSVQKRVKLIVAQPVVFTSDDETTFVAGEDNEFLLTASGYPLADIDLIGSLPAGVKIRDDGPNEALLYGTPKKAGTYHFKLAFGTGGDFKRVYQEFTLIVEPPI